MSNINELRAVSQPKLGRLIGDFIVRRHDRHMPGNPFPPDSVWGRELDRMYAADRAMERSRREVRLPRSARVAR